MNPLFRSPATAQRLPLRCRPALGAMLLSAAFGAQAQQWTAGQAQWNASGCNTCHSGNFPLSLMQSTYANNTIALTRLNSAIMIQGGMAQYGSGANALNTTQRDNLSYFISNFRAEGAAFINAGSVSLTVPAVQQTAQATVRLQNNGKAVLRVSMSGGQQLSGDITQFSVTGVGNGCDAQTLAAGAFCDVTVTYRPQVAPASQHSLTLTFVHNGEPNTTSSVTLTGRISAAPAPAPAPAPAASSGGGGAVAPVLWALLLPAALGLRRRHGGGRYAALAAPVSKGGTRSGGMLPQALTE